MGYACVYIYMIRQQTGCLVIYFMWVYIHDTSTADRVITWDILHVGIYIHDTSTADRVICMGYTSCGYIYT